METVLIVLIVAVAAAGFTGKVVKDARRFKASAPTDCGCGRGSDCKKTR